VLYHKIEIPTSVDEKPTNPQGKSYTPFSLEFPITNFCQPCPRISLLLLVTFLKAHRLRCHAFHVVVSHCSFATILSPSKRLCDHEVVSYLADMVRALQAQLLWLMYVLCENETETVLTPLALVKKLVVQLLDLFPEFAYQGPSFFDGPVFKE
jgi:hypothetical protein